ncbi:mannosidase [Coprinopsis marcescibilis]|uniref:alpha-1,2-Mannosidase n=1 Tax=Coprinopsis marcescibilis TaxID=230819 RepID=A0A5C3L1Y5_COPMA|nr:mannosidase [Coprinopsis marcescibilis]
MYSVSARSYQKLLIRFRQFSREKPIQTKIIFGALGLVLAVALFKSLPGAASSTIFKYSGADAYVPSNVWRYRADQVKQAIGHAYHGYEKYAMPKDELRPMTEEGMNQYNGWALTVFDSLDTLWLLGFKDEYKRALKVVESIDFKRVVHVQGQVPFFETVIRYLGGMLSAYALTKDPMLLRRAEDLADTLQPIFSSPSGLAWFSLNPSTNTTAGETNGVLAEIASFQLEYTYLAHATGKKKYLEPVQTLNKLFYQANLGKTNGMLPIDWNLATGVPRGHDIRISVGAQADSSHEYLLKQYLLTAKTDKVNLELYLHATSHILTNLLYMSPNRQMLYVTDTVANSHSGNSAVPSHVFEHLSCFLPGLLALGADRLPLDDLSKLGIDLNTLGADARFGNASRQHQAVREFDLKKLHMWAAEGLAQSCWMEYADQASGLGPDEVLMSGNSQGTYVWDPVKNSWVLDSPAEEASLWLDVMKSWKHSGSKAPIPGLTTPRPVSYSGRGSGRDYYIRKANYLLRPETVESLYILWKVTGDPKWRARGWAIFEAIEREAKTSSGYVTIKNVALSPPTRGNSMPSFFLAETLKYLYLLFSEEDKLPIDKWVFNTEAHPFPVFSWTEEERRIFNISL